MHLDADVVIVGSGIAALRAAAELAGGELLILTKAGPREGSTDYAQGGIAAALGPDDSPELHAADTIRAGDGLCNEAAVRVLVEEGPRYIRELIQWGARFDMDAGERLPLAREGAHSVRRVLHARDATGREIERTLWQRVSRVARPSLLTHASVTDLIVSDGRACGVRFITPTGETGSAIARGILLATGGAGRVFAETTNPTVATGDGIAIAYRAGARVADLEFVQFHPTALKLPGAPRFLLSEALRGEGARLLNRHGEAFMTRYDPAGDLASRDRVARAIVEEEGRTGGPVVLSLEHLDAGFVHARFPAISATCRRFGLDLARDRLPVGPAAHYVMGGIETDLDGRTSVPGLYAAGETACTGVHGANRLASNSLLEGLVFGARAGAAIRRDCPWGNRRVERLVDVKAYGRVTDALARLQSLASEVRRLMWESVGVVRDRTGLVRVLARLDDAWGWIRQELDALPAVPAAWEAANLVLVGRLIGRAALDREESRGAHFRADFPRRDDLHWKRHLTYQVAVSG